MSLNVILTGATGMVGKGVLLECLDSPQVAKVIAVNRQTLGMDHPKLSEILISDFLDLDRLKTITTEIDACFYCMGVSALGMSEEDYTTITHEITLNFADIMANHHPSMTFCYVSGAGTNVNSRTMWARVKGRTEEDLLKLPFRKVYLFRPGYIQPLRGIKSKTTWYNMAYAISSPFYGLMTSMFPGATTDTSRVGKAMIKVATLDHPNKYLTNQDINQLALSDSQPD